LETLDIQANVRAVGTKNQARRLRRMGKIPAILYGPKTQPVPLELDKKDFSARVAMLGGSHLVRLKSPAPALADKVALVKEMQFHPISSDVIHTDLYEVDLAAKITVQVPLRFIGKAVGVTHGGILQPIVREVAVECLPLDIPSAFNVDVSALDIGDSIHIEEIQTPEGVSLVFDSNFAVVTVATPTVEEAPAAAAPVEGEAAVAAVAEPKEEEASGED